MTRKDQKKFEEFKRFYSLLGIDLDSITTHLTKLEAENTELKAKISCLEEKLSKKIDERCSRLEENVNKRADQNAKNIENQMKTYLFKGSKIDEKY